MNKVELAGFDSVVNISRDRDSAAAFNSLNLKTLDIANWLHENIGPGVPALTQDNRNLFKHYDHVWYSQVWYGYVSYHFKNPADATLFTLKWCR